MTSHPNESHGPLQDRATVVVVGGGPGGAACAIALKKISRNSGRDINVVLYEAKSFSGEPHYNQCIGVLSPPADRILEDKLGTPFPHHIVQRLITGYVLHADRRSIVLDDDKEPSYALRRVQFDDYLLNQARLHGVQVVNSRVTDLEFYSDRVIVFSESDSRHAAVVVGACGLDDGSSALMHRALTYRPPEHLTTIVTKIHPGPEVMAQFGNRIHAFLLPEARIEFGAITPKGNHLSINIAGENINVGTMKRFLTSSSVREVLHFDCEELKDLEARNYFKGRFPISIAQGFYGDRYVLVGDAAGLVRAFKGKGINSACESGLWAAEVMMEHGVSRDAFADHYRTACREILSDVPYGRAVRRLVAFGRRSGLINFALSAAEAEPVFQTALFDAVSGNRTYRAILGNLCNRASLGRVLRGLLRAAHRHRLRAV